MINDVLLTIVSVASKLFVYKQRESITTLENKRKKKINVNTSAKGGYKNEYV